MFYTKHFIPLECNPDLFTQLIHILGATSASTNLVFQDVLSLDSDMLALILRPVLALILVFPTSEVYEKEKAAEESTKEDYKGQGETEDVIWFKQTINNACGFYGILHAMQWRGERDDWYSHSTHPDEVLIKFIAPDSTMAWILSSYPCTSRPIKGHRGLGRN